MKGTSLSLDSENTSLIFEPHVMLVRHLAYYGQLTLIDKISINRFTIYLFLLVKGLV